MFQSTKKRTIGWLSSQEPPDSRGYGALLTSEHVAETGDGDLANISYVGEGDDFSVFAVRDSEDRWCVVLYNEPLPDNPDDWSVGSSCRASEDFVNSRIWVQAGSPSRMHTAQLLPDNFTGDIDKDLELMNDNLAAKKGLLRTAWEMNGSKPIVIRFIFDEVLSEKLRAGDRLGVIWLVRGRRGVRRRRVVGCGLGWAGRGVF